MTYLRTIIYIHYIYRLRRVRVVFGPEWPGGGQRLEVRAAVQEQLQHPSPGEEVPRAVSLRARHRLHHVAMGWSRSVCMYMYAMR